MEERVLAIVESIQSHVKENHAPATDEDVVDILYAYLVLYAMNSKLVGVTRSDAMEWLRNQWDSVRLPTKPRPILSISPVVH